MEREELTYICGRRSVVILLRKACIIISTSYSSLELSLGKVIGRAFGCYKKKKKSEIAFKEKKQ